MNNLSGTKRNRTVNISGVDVVEENFEDFVEQYVNENDAVQPKSGVFSINGDAYIDDELFVNGQLIADDDILVNPLKKIKTNHVTSLDILENLLIDANEISIKSNGENGDIIIDAGGDGIMKFNTIVNNGCLFGGETGAFTWAIKTVHGEAANSAPCCVVGSSTIPGDELISAIGSNNLAATDWTPLYIQPVDINATSGSYVSMGNLSTSFCGLTGAKLIVQDKIYATGDISSAGRLKLRDNNYFSIYINGTQPNMSDVVHDLPPNGGTLAHTSMIYSPDMMDTDFFTSSTSYVKLKSFIFPGTTKSASGNTTFIIAHNTTNGDTLNVRLRDVTNGFNLWSESFIGSGTSAVQTMATVSTPWFPEESLIELQVNVSAGSTTIQAVFIKFV